MYQITRLPNGLTVASAPMADRTSVSVGLWVKVGGRYESVAQNGTCHFIEHMLFKGTRRRSAREISQAVEGIGGYLNAFTGEETTCFYSRARHDRLEELVDVLFDMLLHSRFDRADVDKERNVIKEELAMYLDQPQHHVQELLNATLWPDHALGRPLTGTPASLDRLGRPELLGFMRHAYVTSASLLVAAGRVNHAQLVRMATRRTGRFPIGPPPQPEPAREQQRRPQVRHATKDIEQAQLALGLRTCSRLHPRRYALRLLNTLLGENMSSRLFQEVREDRGLAYTIYSSQSYFADTGALVVSAGLDVARVHQTLTLILRELRRFRDTPPPRAEFNRARDYILGQMDLSLESPENLMLWVGEQWTGHGRVQTPTTVRRRLAALTPREVQAAAREFFQTDRLNLALVSPLKSTARLERTLRL